MPDLETSFQNILHHIEQNQFQDAIEACYQTIQLDPTYVNASIYLAHLFNRTGQYEKALEIG